MTTFPYSDPGLGSGTALAFTTTALNGLTTGSRTISDTTLDNTGGTGSGRYPFGWMKIILGSHAAAAGDRFMGWALPGDGTTDEDAVTSADPASAFLIVNRPLRAATAVHNVWVVQFRLAPMIYKFMFKNASASVALAASGCSVTVGRYALETRA